jgi:Zn finger protein HypA/HybF involved in hydrogenase expression
MDIFNLILNVIKMIALQIQLENLQILCSNCHSIAHEYCNTKGKKEPTVNYYALEESLNKKQYEIVENHRLIKVNKFKPKKEKVKRFCKTCGKELKSHQKNYCSYECSYKGSRKIPSVEVLTTKLHEFNFNKSKTGRYFGVSDRAVGKWIKKYNIT